MTFRLLGFVLSSGARYFPSPEIVACDMIMPNKSRSWKRCVMLRNPSPFTNCKLVLLSLCTYYMYIQSLVRRMVWKHHFTPSSHDLRQQNCLPVPSSGHPWPRHHAVSRDWICSAAVPIIWYPQPHRNQLHKNSSRHPQSLPRKLNYIHKTRS